MLTEWLEPMIEKRIDEVTNVCDSNSGINELYDKILEIWGEMKINLPYQFQVIDIEKIINARTRKVIEVSYRAGFKDGLKVDEGKKQCL